MPTTPALSELLVEAAVLAGRAPSLHNSQPWHWVVGPGTLDLRLDLRRTLRTIDPHARLAVLSCGAALHHARIHLAAAGRHPEVTRLPDLRDEDLLARLRPAARSAADHDAVRLLRQVPRRRTDRHNGPAAPLDLHRVRGVQRAVRAQGAELTVLNQRQVFAAAQAAEAARDAEAADPAWQAELAEWVGGDPRRRSGIPTGALPADPYTLTAPARTLSRGGPALVAETREHAAVFTVLHSAGDARIDWLTAGEGLSAGWLTATALDVAVLPLSVVTEVAGARSGIRGLLGDSGHPHLLLRLATAADANGPPATPRLKPAECISYG